MIDPPMDTATWADERIFFLERQFRLIDSMPHSCITPLVMEALFHRCGEIAQAALKGHDAEALDAHISELTQLRADLARVTGERDDWKKLANKYMDKCAVMLSEKMDQPTPPTGG